MNTKRKENFLMSREKQLEKAVRDIAIIKTEMKLLSKSFDNFFLDYKEWCKQINRIENEQIEIRTKTNNLAIFQSVFSVIIGAIATYLGAERNK